MKENHIYGLTIMPAQSTSNAWKVKKRSYGSAMQHISTVHLMNNTIILKHGRICWVCVCSCQFCMRTANPKSWFNCVGREHCFLVSFTSLDTFSDQNILFSSYSMSEANLLAGIHQPAKFAFVNNFGHFHVFHNRGVPSMNCFTFCMKHLLKTL